MPSLANNSKASESKPSDAPSEAPFNQMLTIVEHKIRNLEKRKTKLDGYRDLEKKGEKLTTEQKHACKKYEEVIHSLDLAKELNKQFAQLAKEANRDAKRESKRSAFLRTQLESKKIREVLVIQDILRSLADDAVRQDFLDGTNGAVKIEQSDMDLLEKLYVEVTPKRPTRSDELTFLQSATHSANTFSSVIDSRPKSFGDSTYEHVKETLQSIQNCGYFEKEIIKVEEKARSDIAETESDIELAAEEEKASSEADVNPDSVEAPSANAVPQPKSLIMHAMLQQQQQQPPVPLNNASVGVAAAVPMPVTTVRAVEQNYYKQYIQQPPPPQPTLRPIHEVIGTGNFHFLQDSELDSSDMILTTGPFPQAGMTVPPQIVPQPLQQQKLPTTPNMVPGIIPANAHPPTATPVLPPNAAPRDNPVTPIVAGVGVQPGTPVNALQSSFPGNNGFPTMAPVPQQQQQPQPTMFNANVLASKATDQPHIPPFTNSPQLPQNMQPNPQIPGFAMNQQTPQNAMAQIAQLQSMIQQQQQMSGSIKVQQPTTQQQDLVNADDLTEKLKSTLHINDNNTSSNKTDNLLKASQSPIVSTNSDSQDWNDVNNDANSWSNQMAEESNRNNDRFKRSSNNNGNIGGMFRSSDNNGKYGGGGGGGNSYRPRNSYQNGGGNRGMQSNGNDNNSSSSVFFRNNDRYYNQNGGNKDGGNSYKSSSSAAAGNGNLGSYKPRSDMLNNRPPRMQSGAPGGGGNDYRSRPGQGNNGRDNRGGLKA